MGVRAATLPACRARLPPVRVRAHWHLPVESPNPSNPRTSPCPSRRSATQSVLLPHRRTCPVRAFTRSFLPILPFTARAVSSPRPCPSPRPFHALHSLAAASSKSKSFLVGSRRAFPPSPNPHSSLAPDLQNLAHSRPLRFLPLRPLSFIKDFDFQTADTLLLPPKASL